MYTIQIWHTLLQRSYILLTTIVHLAYNVHTFGIQCSYICNAIFRSAAYNDHTFGIQWSYIWRTVFRYIWQAMVMHLAYKEHIVWYTLLFILFGILNSRIWHTIFKHSVFKVLTFYIQCLYSWHTFGLRCSYVWHIVFKYSVNIVLTCSLQCSYIWHTWFKKWVYKSLTFE